VATSDFFLFVSHVAENRVSAMEIVDELERRGTRCWIAPRDVRPGESFDDEIADAIEASRAMLLIFSDLCNDSEYIRREVTVAGESRKTVIPFRIEDVQPRRGLRVRLSDLHWIDGFTSRERAIDEVIKRFAPSRDAPGAPPYDGGQQNTLKVQTEPKAADTIGQSPPIMPVTPEVPTKEPIRPLPLSHKEETPKEKEETVSRTTAPAQSNITSLQVVCALLVLQGIGRAGYGVFFPHYITLIVRLFFIGWGATIVVIALGIVRHYWWARVLLWFVVCFGPIIDGILYVVASMDNTWPALYVRQLLEVGFVFDLFAIICTIVVSVQPPHRARQVFRNAK
jgi:hypothetical protein